jgi:Zn-dependent protease with chaperone function
VNAVLCLFGYALAVGLLAPLCLSRLVSWGVSPMLAMAAWWCAAGSALVSCWVGVIDIRSHATGPETWIAIASLLVVSWATLRILTSIIGGLRDASRRRVAHLTGLSLVGRRSRRLNATIVDWPEPVAYCLPARPGVVVLSSAALRALSGRELRAVLEHERAHLAGNHSTISTIARGISHALPHLPLFAQLGQQIATLLEMRADDRAARHVGRRTVAGALAAMAPMTVTFGSMAMAGPGVLDRAKRLIDHRRCWRSRLASALTLLVVGGLMIGPYLHTLAPWCIGE